MNIAIPSIGSRGDVQPFIGLAQGLALAGFHVKLATHPGMKGLVESHGVSILPIGPDIDLAKEFARIRKRSRSAIMGLVHVMRFSFDMLRQSHDDLLAICRDSALIIITAQSAAGKNESDQLGVPYLSAILMPWAIPWKDPKRPLFKRILYSAIDALAHTINTRPLNRIRIKQRLPPVGEEGFTSLRLNLVPVSPSVYPPNPLWNSRHRMVGYWFAEAPEVWTPPAKLLSFLEKGTPPILVSLGAMSVGDEDASESASLFVSAIQQTGIRAIVQGWDAGIRQISLPPNIHAGGPLPHQWLLSRCAAIVHHGGFGTTAADMQAGIPALVIPHIADQFYWGKQVYGLGVGLKPIARSRLNEKVLAASLDELVHNEKLHIAAASIGAEIRSEDGIGNAVHLIKDTFT